MPLYEYQCSICGETSEMVQSFDEPIPSCCGQLLDRLLSSFGFKIRGPGMEKYKGKNFKIQANEYVERMQGWEEPGSN